MSSSTAAQRKAWNDAMRSAAGTAALPPALQPQNRKRRSDRHKSKLNRRTKARKVVSLQSTDGEGQELLSAAWMDSLEDVNTGTAAAGGQDDDDDDYDELEDLEEDEKKKSKNRRARKKKSPQQGNTHTLPKRFKPRSLASILLEEVNRDDGIAHAWLEIEARVTSTKMKDIMGQKQHEGQFSYSSTSSSSQLLPPRQKFCPVTGLEGIYTEPKTGIPYANLAALEQIRERSPPWMMLSGSMAYHEAVKSIRDDD